MYIYVGTYINGYLFQNNRKELTFYIIICPKTIVFEKEEI